MREAIEAIECTPTISIRELHTDEVDDD